MTSTLSGAYIATTSTKSSLRLLALLLALARGAAEDGGISAASNVAVESESTSAPTAYWVAGKRSKPKGAMALYVLILYIKKAGV